MSLLDKVSRAVGDVMDKGKKDVEQFVRIQKINNEIGGMEKRIREFEQQIQQARQAAGERAIELVRSAALAAPELQPFADQVRGFEEQVEAERAAIAAKRADIERIKAEHAAEHVAAVAPSAGPIPPSASAIAEGKFCGHCGAKLAGGTFCPECGAKLP